MWRIQCLADACSKDTYAANIVELINDHRDADGWFHCASCNERGYIAKSFAMQEPGHKWQPFLNGIITLGYPGDPYQPFVFLVSNDAGGPTNPVWFSYFKDLRSTGGRLKLGHGPGGPPVLDIDQVDQLREKLASIGSGGLARAHRPPGR